MMCRKVKMLAATIVAVAGLTAGTWAQTWKCGADPDSANVTATLIDGTLTISGTGAMADYSVRIVSGGISFMQDNSRPYESSANLITSVVIGSGVTSIGGGAFRAFSSLTTITIPSGVTSIGMRAFDLCTGLTSVSIPSSVTTIGESAFSYCSGLTSVTIPTSVTSIEAGAFYGCSGLTSITIPNSVTSLGYNAFNDGCSGLTTISIGDGLTSVNGFGALPNLTTIEVSGGNTKYSSLDGVLFNKAQDTLLRYPIGKQGAYKIPDGVKSVGVAFSGNRGLTSVTIPESMTSIAAQAFEACSSLTSITIPNSVTSIGSRAFNLCTALTSVTIPEGVTSINDWTFRGCTNLASVTIPNSVTSIGIWAFISCHSLTSIDIPNSVTSIGRGAFSYTGLTSVIIPNSVTGLAGSSSDNGAFQGCTGLKSVTIGSGVTGIGKYVFSGCSNLTSIISLSETPPTIEDANAFSGVPIESVEAGCLEYPEYDTTICWESVNAACLYVPEASIEAYGAAYVWEDFNCIKSLDEYTTSVLSPNRVIPQTKPTEEATVVAPTVVLSGEFTAGPNPVLKQSGIVNFFRQGKRVANCELRIYDATGNIVNSVKISDKAIGNQARRQVGSWDLCDRNGRIVSEGTYLVKGVIKTSDGKSEKVSVIVGVR